MYYKINEEAAKRANDANRFCEYQQGSATANYHRMVDKAVEIAENQKKRVDSMYHDKIDWLLDTYCRKLADNLNARNAIDARVPSVMISGGSNFPVGKKAKQNAARDRNYEEYRNIEGLLDKIRSTGMGGEYIIIDDPVKNREDADSATIREKIYDWYTSTLYTRLEKDGCILLTLTRWHEDDLAGKLLKAAGEGADQWTVLELPAVCEYPAKPYDVRQEGEALWKWKYDEQALAKMKATVGSRDWAALYQQHPTPGEGGTFKREWWNYYKVLPDGLYDFVQSWDCTFKDAQSSDYVVGQVWARKGSSRYLLDQARGRMSFTETLYAIRSLSAKWPQAVRKLVEDKANGTAVIDVLRKEIPGLIPVEPEGGKIVRANAVTAVVEAGNVFLPDPSIAPWVHDFVEEHTAFPNGANDDQVDAQTQANTYYNSSSFSLEGLI